MLKSLFPDVEWSAVNIVGCDMDGTLYDEADFIAEVYREIASSVFARGSETEDVMFKWMYRRWLEKGSSYSRIFSEAAVRAGVPPAQIDERVAIALKIFREFQPSISLPPRVEAILDELAAHFKMFLVSDGSALLQMRKFYSLKLERWFSEDDVVISGSFGDGFNKPSLKIIPEIPALYAKFDPKEVLYIGDRIVDSEFAKNAGFQFLQVSSMFSVVSQEKVRL